MSAEESCAEELLVLEPEQAYTYSGLSWRSKRHSGHLLGQLGERRRRLRSGELAAAAEATGAC